MSIMNKKGIITISQKELYYVKSYGKIYKSKARGVFREQKIKPLVGDKVEIQILNENEAYIEKVFERSSEIIRPPVANINQIILVQSLVSPKINYNIFDKYLVMLEHLNIPVIIVINKVDLIDEKLIAKFLEIYKKTNYRVITASSFLEHGLDDIKKELEGKISVLAGPSGVGKSSLLNAISPQIEVKTGSISYKTERGKHTTRHTELFSLNDDTFILDTPGFTSLNLDFINDYMEVEKYFPEFIEYKKGCKFQNCQHINEPLCNVKDAVKNSLLSKRRYDNYVSIREEIMSKRRYK